MPKGRSKEKAAAGDTPSGSKAGKGHGTKGDAARRAKLEKKLARAVREEARRRGQYEQAAADRAALAGQLLELTQGSPVAPAVPSSDAALAAAPASAAQVVTAYCLRQKKRVALRDPEPVTLRNGRRAIAGTCTECGARIVRLGS